jgi:hypothetical protein
MSVDSIGIPEVSDIRSGYSVLPLPSYLVEKLHRHIEQQDTIE